MCIRDRNKIGDDVPTVQNPEYFRDAFLAVQELVNKGLIMAGHDISAGGLITTPVSYTHLGQHSQCI